MRGSKQLPVSVDTAEDGAVLLVDCRRLMTTCSNACSFHSRLIFNLLKTVARKNIELHRHAEIVSGRTTREKLMSYLTMQASQAGTLEFVVPFDRQALADHLGVDRSGLSAEIGKLKREGILECSRSSFRLLRGI